MLVGDSIHMGYCPAHTTGFSHDTSLNGALLMERRSSQRTPKIYWSFISLWRLRYCLRNNYWTAETPSNISPVSAPLLSSTPPEAWLPNHLKYDMNEARGAGAYAWITNKGYKFHACSFFSPPVAIPLNFRIKIWSNMLEFVLLKYISKEIESRLWHTVNHDLNVTPLICMAKLDFWNLALYTSWSLRETWGPLISQRYDSQISFTASTPFFPFPFLLCSDESFSAPIPSLYTGLLRFPPPTAGAQSLSPSIIASSFATPQAELPLHKLLQHLQNGRPAESSHRS